MDYLFVWREWPTRLARTTGNGTHITQNSNSGDFNTTERQPGPQLDTWWAVDTLQWLCGRVWQGLSFGLERVAHQVSKNCGKWDPHHAKL